MFFLLFLLDDRRMIEGYGILVYSWRCVYSWHNVYSWHDVYTVHLVQVN